MVYDGLKQYYEWCKMAADRNLYLK